MQIPSISPVVASRGGMAAPSAPVLDAPAAARPGQFEVRRGEAIPAGVPGTPASRFVRDHAHTLLSMPGMMTVGWGYPANDVLLWAEDELAASVLKGILEPAVGDVNLKIGIYSTRQPYEGPANEQAGPRTRAISAMPGVWDYRHDGNAVWGIVTFRTVNQEYASRLDALIQDKLSWGTTPKGQPRFMRVRWLPGVPA